MKNAVNGIGEVYLNIPAERGGMGKVSIKVQGSLRELEAMTDDNEDLMRGSVVQVVDVINEHILLVSKHTK